MHLAKNGTVFLKGVPNPKQEEFFLATARHIAYGGSRGGGKATTNDTPICTPHGFVPMGDLRVGDYVTGRDGKPTKVTAVYPQGEVDTYEVTFIDGASIRVCGNHLWLAKETCTRKGWRVYTTLDLINIMENLRKGSHILIPMCEPVEFNAKHLTGIKPYTLGVILGDGATTGKTVMFTTEDEEIQKNVEADGYLLTHYKDSITYGFRQFMNEHKFLKENGLCVRSEGKHVPKEYLYASVEDRFSLLQGLMDTDGYADDRGHIDFASVSKQLAEDVQFLVRSLGGRATLSFKEKNYAVTNGERIEGQPVYRVYIRMRNNASVFRLQRKKDRCSDKPYNGGISDFARRIISIVPAGKAECTCIKVDAPDHLFVAKDFIVTHNSWAMRRKFVLLAMRYNGLKLLLLRRTFPELEANHIMPLRAELDGFAKYSTEKRMFTFPNGSIIKLGYCDTEADVYQYQGQEYDVIGFEEATQFTPFQMQYISTSNRTTRTDFSPRIYYTCNPGGVGHDYIKRLFIDRRFTEDEDPNDYVFIPAKVSDNKVLMEADPNYVKTLKALPEHLRKAYLEGDWDTVEGQFFSEFQRSVHVIQPFTIPDTWRRFRSMDWGYNDPCCVLWYAVSPDKHVYVYREYYVRQTLATDVAADIRELSAFEHIDYTVASPDAWQQRGLRDVMSGESIADTFLYNGVPLIKADNNRLSGWQRVRENLAIAPDGKPYVQIFDTCYNLIRTLPLLTYGKISTGSHEDVAGNLEDHAPESLRYGLMSRPSPAPQRNILKNKRPAYDPFSQPKLRVVDGGYFNLRT